MVKLLRARWREHYLDNTKHWNAGNEFIPCMAHIIHNAVLELLKALSASPAETNDIYNRSNEYGIDPELTDVSCSQTPRSSHRHRTFPKLATLSGFARTMEKLRMIAMASTNSSQRHEQFQEIVKATLGKSLRLLLDVKTRWHSTATMLKRALELKQPVNSWLQLRPELEPLRLTNSEWSQVELILSALRPFWSCAYQLMKASVVNIHMGYAIYNFLFDHIEDYTQKLQADAPSSSHRQQLVEALQAAERLLKKYYGQSDDNMTYYASILLNPRVKSKFFLREL